MTQLLLLVACLAAGMLLRHSGRLNEQGAAGINAVILNVSLPALTLVYLHGFSFNADHLAPLLMPWLLFLLGMAVFWLASRWLVLDRGTTGALMLVGGFGNTSFVGLPMIEALYGREGLGLGMAVDQLGTYLALSTLGLVVVGLYAADAKPTAAGMVQRVLRFPPFIAMAAALLLSPLEMPEAVRSALLRVGDTLAPLALLWVGTQFNVRDLVAHRVPLTLGLGYKLLVCPLLVVGVMSMANGLEQVVEHVSVIQAAMPPMIGAAMVAANAGLAPRFVAAMIGLGIPASLLTAPGWYALFGVLA